MTPNTFDHVTSGTLETYADFVSHQNPAALRQRLAEGQLNYEQLCQMHSRRGLEAAWVKSAAPILFPHVRSDLDTVGRETLAQHLAATAPDKRIVLNEGMAPTDDAPWLSAGWVLHAHAVMARTDLTARSWPLDPRVQERPISELLAPDLLDLYASLAEVGTIGDTGETDPTLAFKSTPQDEEKRLFVLTEDGGALGAALLIPAPPQLGTGIHMLGVRPGCRGQGLGLALHAHLLAIAALTYDQHGGTTEWNNHAMRRIFERNGAVLSEQKQFILPG